MARYMWCAYHSFTSMEDLKKHLGRDEKVMMDILPQLKKAGLTEAKRGILTEAEGKYYHQGILIFDDIAHKDEFQDDICNCIEELRKHGKHIKTKHIYIQITNASALTDQPRQALTQSCALHCTSHM